MNRVIGFFGLILTLLLAGCTTPASYDYTAFRASNPKTILVLPPINDSMEITAGYGVVSQVTYPLAEAGYYVLPVAVVEETFKQNGLTSAADAHSVSLAKLYEIFGADAVLYINVTEYGTEYKLISSDTRVSAKARLVDARTGQQLWSGSATASTRENESNNNGLLGMLLSAAVNQIANTINDKSYDIAGVTDQRLLSGGRSRGLLYGPR